MPPKYYDIQKSSCNTPFTEWNLRDLTKELNKKNSARDKACASKQTETKINPS